MDKDIKILTSDNVERTIKKSKVERSKLLSEAKDEVIKVDINYATLEIVLQYLEHYLKEDPKPTPFSLKSSDLKAELNSDWDFELVNHLTYEQTFHLINAAAVLGLDYLHDLACAKIAAFMKDKAPEEVNKEFTIECQLTADEAKSLGLDVEEEK